MNLRTEHIPSGTFTVEQKKEVIFQAFLGTCVGVALYDHTAMVGGLLHILLPEPPSAFPPQHPEKYASTALPLFISALEQAGARRQDLTAVIAGGALVGPVSQTDINLDIGGRSAEKVLAILEQKNIVVVASETGGFFTCTLELNMKTGKSAIKPAIDHQAREQPLDYSPPSKEMILKTIDTLKPIPQSALKILRMIQQGNHDMKSITEVLSKDQVLGGLTLKICNSALFSGKIKIETLRDAVLLLGEAILMGSVITAAVKNYFNQTGHLGYSLCKGGLFFHAVGSAETAKAIARLTGKADPHKAYTAGLLHDIGKVVLDQYIARICPVFFRGVNHNQKNSLAIEQVVLGTTHCKAGELLAEKWQFPAPLRQVVRHHHNPESCTAHKELVSIVYLANLIMSRFNAGLVLERVSTSSLDAALESLDLDVSDLPELIDAIPLTTFNAQANKTQQEKTTYARHQ
ncbi:MAG: HDOD domain-containing protein [Desulfobacteraceae bacterium]